jgi:hypothetical protein
LRRKKQRGHRVLTNTVASSGLFYVLLWLCVVARSEEQFLPASMRKYGRVEGVFPTCQSRFPINENASSEYDVRQEDVCRTYYRQARWHVPGACQEHVSCSHQN